MISYFFKCRLILHNTNLVTSLLSFSRNTAAWPWKCPPGSEMENSSHTLPPSSLPFSSSPQQSCSSGRLSLPLSPISFPPSPTSLSPATAESLHSSSPISHCTASQCFQGPSVRCLSQTNISDQDDLTCLNWLHQRGNLLPLQPLPKMAPLPQLESTQSLPPALSKPPYSFSSLIFMAIEDSPNKMLPVKDIYEWIVNNFPYYRTASGGWRNSVRHNLSLSKSFCRIQRDKSQVGRQVTVCTLKADMSFEEYLLL